MIFGKMCLILIVGGGGCLIVKLVGRKNLKVGVKKKKCCIKSENSSKKSSRNLDFDLKSRSLIDKERALIEKYYLQKVANLLKVQLDLKKVSLQS